MGAYLKILLGASLWGMIAIFVITLGELGFTEMEIVTLRVGWAALFLFMIGIMKYRHILSIKKRKDVGYFVGTGILSIVFFNWCYFTAMNEMNISVAVILLYTSPVFVTILSFLFLKERLSTKKIIAVAGTIIGCILIAGMGSGAIENITPIGILIGLGSGFFYALYSIFSKFALRTYHPFVVTFYTFLFATVFLLPVTQLWNKLDLLLTSKALFYSAGLGLIPTVFGFLLYTSGLKTVDSSKAAIIATVEPFVATFLGVFIYSEKLSTIQLFGSLLILCSVLIVQLPNRKKIVSHTNLVSMKKL